MNFEIISHSYACVMMFTWIDNRFLSSQFLENFDQYANLLILKKID